MEQVFVDTAAWIALVNERDQMRLRAREILQQLLADRVLLFTTEFVLLELADALSAPHLRAKTITFIEGLRQNARLEILPASTELLNEGWNLYCRRPDKEWGLTDCISFSVMTQRGLTRAFTSDHHFVQAGFEKLV